MVVVDSVLYYSLLSKKETFLSDAVLLSRFTPERGDDRGVNKFRLRSRAPIPLLEIKKGAEREEERVEDLAPPPPPLLLCSVTGIIKMKKERKYLSASRNLAFSKGGEEMYSQRGWSEQVTRVKRH